MLDCIWLDAFKIW